MATYSPGYNRVLLGATESEVGGRLATYGRALFDLTRLSRQRQVNHDGGQRRPRAYSSAEGQGLYFDASACSAETLIGFKNSRDLLGNAS